MTDRQTDGQTDARGKTICLPTLAGGRHNRHENIICASIVSHSVSLMYLIPFNCGSTISLVGKVPDGRGFEPHQGRGVLSLSKTLHLHCLGKRPNMTEKLLTGM